MFCWLEKSEPSNDQGFKTWNFGSTQPSWIQVDLTELNVTRLLDRFDQNLKNYE